MSMSFDLGGRDQKVKSSKASKLSARTGMMNHEHTHRGEETHRIPEPSQELRRLLAFTELNKPAWARVRERF